MPLLADAAHEDRYRAAARRLRIRNLPRLLDYLHALFETIHAFFGGEERHLENLVLVLVPSRADAEDQAAAAQEIDGGGLSREHGRHVKCQRAHHRAELDGLGPFRRQRQRSPAVDAVAVAGLWTHQ